MHVHVYGYTACACGGQRSTLDIDPLDLSILFFKGLSLGSQIRLD